MICPDCRGRGWTPRLSAMDDEPDDLGPMMGPCETCGGCGIASCCDTAGAMSIFSPSKEEAKIDIGPIALCFACGAVQVHNLIRCEECGEPLVFPIRLDPYTDPRFAPRNCDLCGKTYQGPAVYCSMACALDDAA